MRHIQHPGAISEERFHAVPCLVSKTRLVFRAGVNVNEAVADAFSDAGFSGGYIHLKNAPTSRLNYVIPAGAPDEKHAAWYSATHPTVSGATILDAGLQVGQREGVPFIHCHGQWDVEGEGLRMGHLLPFEAEFTEPVEAEVWGISGAFLDVVYNAETNFHLFSPKQTTREKTGDDLRRALLCTVSPNTDISNAIETICRENGMARAEVLGIGSLVGADYQDGGHVASYATEVLIRNGQVVEEGGEIVSELDIALVDMFGGISGGRLVRGQNPVCVTFELLIVETAPGEGS